MKLYTAHRLITQGEAGDITDGAAVLVKDDKFEWVGREADFPASDYPNGRAPGGGLPEWTAANRSLDGEDLVLWHTFGPTHIPRTEDWPIMPVDYSGFWFKPHGFLDQNPAMNLPEDARSKSSCAMDGSAGPCCTTGGCGCCNGDTCRCGNAQCGCGK